MPNAINLSRTATFRTTARLWDAVGKAERAEERAATAYARRKTMKNREAWEAAEKAVAAARIARDAHEEAVRAAAGGGK